MSDVTDEAIDNDLRLDGFDPNENYPEYGHSALRTAWRNGYEAGELRTAAAEAELARLRVAVDAVRALHASVYYDEPGLPDFGKLFCSVCRPLLEPWPCPTLRALDGAGEGQQ